MESVGRSVGRDEWSADRLLGQSDGRSVDRDESVGRSVGRAK